MSELQKDSAQPTLDEENEMILMIDRLNHALAESRGREDLGFNEILLPKCSQRTCMERLGVYLPADWKPEPRPSIAMRKHQFERRWSGLMAPANMPRKATPPAPSEVKLLSARSPKKPAIGRASARRTGIAKNYHGGPSLAP